MNQAVAKCRQTPAKVLMVAADKAHVGVEAITLEKSGNHAATLRRIVPNLVTVQNLDNPLEPTAS
jgi:hypothetical protein